MHVNYPTQEAAYSPNYAARILILDDDVRYANHLQRQLSEIGFVNTQAVYNSTDFRNALRMNSADLFLIDIKLGESKTGLDLAKELALQEKAPVIILSNSDDKHYIQQAADLQTTSYLLKGLNRRQLKTTIIHALGNSGQQYIQVGPRNTRIRKSDIVCVSSSGYITTIHLSAEKKDISLCGGFRKIVEELINYQKLVRVHTSFYVNLDYVLGHSASRIDIPRIVKRTSSNGRIKTYDEIPIGATYQRDVLRRLTTLRT